MEGGGGGGWHVLGPPTPHPPGYAYALKCSDWFSDISLNKAYFGQYQWKKNVDSSTSNIYSIVSKKYALLINHLQSIISSTDDNYKGMYLCKYDMFGNRVVFVLITYHKSTDQMYLHEQQKSWFIS